jgi:hypothetical protein
MNYSGTYAPFHAPEKEINGSETMDNELLVIKTEIYDINGREIIGIKGPADINSLSLQSGVYIVKTTFSDGTFKTNKIIK